MKLSDTLAAGSGALLAFATHVGSRRVSAASPVVPAAAGLVTAAVIYPAARARRPAASSVARRENLAVVATAGVMAAAVLRRRRSVTARRLVAAGWLAHAVFDNVHDRGPTSRLPGWYPAACAGYDVALAALLLRE